MFSLSPGELEAVRKCMSKVAGNRKVVAACIYGSRVAGYARPDSDIDLLLVLQEYPYAIKYDFLREGAVEVSVLVVSKKSLEADAHTAALGEFAVGRLLHVYEPLENASLLQAIELAYKRRVILEELQKILESASLLGTEILFPLEYVVFSKIRQRISQYPNAVYSYYKTYSGKNSAQNLQHALRGYRDALADILLEDPSILSRRDGLLQISESAVLVDRGRTSLKLEKGLKQVGSYLVHTYAGRKLMHLMLKEAESKIRRQVRDHVELPANMQSPKTYWQLPEGTLIAESKDWLNDLARSQGIGEFNIAKKRRLGNVNSRTLLFVLKHSGGEYRIAVKELARAKSVKWAALSLWTSPVKRFKVGPLFRLGTEYKAIRFVRKLGLCSPTVEAVVLDDRLLVTAFVEGDTLAETIKDCLGGQDRFETVRLAAAQIARVHNAGASFGNIKPKNVIVSGSRLFFTDLEQFLFSQEDQVWDLAQFISWNLKGTGNVRAASMVAREFLQSYLKVARDGSNVARLAKSRRYVESFFPLMSPAVARAIKNEIRQLGR